MFCRALPLTKESNRKVTRISNEKNLITSHSLPLCTELKDLGFLKNQNLPILAEAGLCLVGPSTTCPESWLFLVTSWCLLMSMVGGAFLQVAFWISFSCRPLCFSCFALRAGEKLHETPARGTKRSFISPFYQWIFSKAQPSSPQEGTSNDVLKYGGKHSFQSTEEEVFLTRGRDCLSQKRDYFGKHALQDVR